MARESAAREEYAVQEKAKGEAYNVAQNRLKEAHRDEYRKLIEEEFQARGLEHKPRLTDFERAQQTVRDLVNKHGFDVVPDDVIPQGETGQ